MEIQLTKEADGTTYIAKGVDFGSGKRAVTFFFDYDASVSLVRLYADGRQLVFTSFLSLTKENQLTVAFEPISGVHDIAISVEGYHDINKIEISDALPVASSEAENKAIAATPPTETVAAKTVAKPIPDAGCDGWVATDMLGRKIVESRDTRAKQKKKQVGLFYWTWHEEYANRRPVSVCEVLEKYPAAEYRFDHPAWGKRPIDTRWGEPLYGFYRTSDEWVLRRHAVLLAAAGVDFILLDCTNGSLLWRPAFEALFAAFQKARRDGIPAPAIGFMLPFSHKVRDGYKSLVALYQYLYRDGRYSDLWFYWDGKPFVMGYPESIPETVNDPVEQKVNDEIRSFFTFRPGQPLYAGGPQRPDHWGWLEIYPQNKYGVRPDGSCEMVTVGVGQNANRDRICTHFNDRGTFGRSYTHRDGHAKLTKDSYLYGYNVQEQWERALDLDPDIVFITGWNEWRMGQYHAPWLSDNDSTQLAMVDQYDREHSRDIEPDKDGYLDTYYLQMVSNIRRFKGMTPTPKPSCPASPSLRCGERAWQKVLPLYHNFPGTTKARDRRGFGDYYYRNTSGRNDIIQARVAADEDSLTFFVKCRETITAPQDGADGWMTLLIDTDRNKGSGWEGYDFAVNLHAPHKNGKTDVCRYVKTLEPNSFTWEKIGSASYRLADNILVIKVDRALLGMKEHRLNFEFKWSDNMQEHTAMDFYQNGCAAPFGRFNYLYQE